MRSWWIAILLVVCGAFVAWHYLAGRNGRIAAPETAALGVLRAPQRGLNGVGGWANDVGRAMVRRDSIVSENEDLRARVEALQGDNVRLERYRRENDELRAMLKMEPRAGGRNVPCDVVALDFSAYARRISLNVGARQNVRPKDVVFTPQGLVGQIIAVNSGLPPTSQVLLLTDRQSSVGAITQRGSAKGIVSGMGGQLCSMSYLDFKADVREGDVVVTAGDSTIFPRGIAIGRVLRVWRNKTYSTMSADIEPLVNFDRLQSVFVRTQAGP